MGPLLLVQAGVHLVDAPGTRCSSAEGRRPDRGPRRRVLRNGEVIARGEVLDPRTVARPHDQRRARSARRSRPSRATPSSTWSRSASCSAGKLELPRFDTDFRDRPVLIVVRGVDHQRDLRALRPYIRDMRPVLVGVDGGANAILEEGFSPDMIVGDMDSATEATLRCGAELVVHAYPDGRAPGRERLERSGCATRWCRRPPRARTSRC